MPIGSLGHCTDLDIMLRFACFDPKEGHGWSRNDVEYPSSPKCVKCRRIWRDRMRKRGLSQSQIEGLFRAVNAKPTWTTKKRETPPARLGIETQQLLGATYCEARANQAKGKTVDRVKVATASSPCGSSHCGGKETATMASRFCAVCGQAKSDK